MKNPNKLYSLGIMSGTSLDGVDIALCLFEKKLTEWHYKLLKYATYAYSHKWKEKLKMQINLVLMILLNCIKIMVFFLESL